MFCKHASKLKRLVINLLRFGIPMHIDVLGNIICICVCLYVCK